MSGICGILHFDGKPVDQSLLERMTALLDYRGPDGKGLWVNGHVGFGHTMFRTTYESANEQQPCSLDGNVYITANARIDARDELIPLLRAKGCKVANDVPDVELILHAYQISGEDCLTHLLGDFAFVIWDGHRQRLFCARDRFGIRVLYYALVGNTLVFSNTLNCVRSYPEVTNKLNEQAIGDFLLFGDYTWLDKSITSFADIQKVPPAHLLTWDSQGLKVRRYWDFPLDTPLLYYRREEDYLEHFREVLRTAVKDRMRTDRIVISMSGGMDSTSVAATACRIVREESSTTQITAFTVVYDQIHPDQERYYSGLVAEKLGLPINYFSGDDYRLLQPIVQTTEPVQDCVPSQRLDMHRRMAELGRVVLTGISTDNLIISSPMTIVSMLTEMNPASAIFGMVRLLQRYGKLPPLGTGLFTKLKSKAKQPQAIETLPSYKYPCWLNPEFETRFKLKERWQANWTWQPSPLHHRHPQAHKWLVFPEWNLSNECKSEQVDFTPPELVDPYMDLRLVEFVLSLLPFPWCFDKYLIRKGMENDLPREVIMRPKTPLGSLPNSLLKLSNCAWVDQWKADPRLLHYVDRQAIPCVSQANCIPKDSLVHLRPLMLNFWLSDA
jgi:asparagine synthase (glutamine-hydrolysing)